MNDENDSKGPPNEAFGGETQLPNSSPERLGRTEEKDSRSTKRPHHEAFDAETTLDPFMAKQHRQSTERYIFEFLKPCRASSCRS